MRRDRLKNNMMTNFKTGNDPKLNQVSAFRRVDHPGIYLPTLSIKRNQDELLKHYTVMKNTSFEIGPSK